MCGACFAVEVAVDVAVEVVDEVVDERAPHEVAMAAEHNSAPNFMSYVFSDGTT
jgi:hypothetical protein